MRNPLVHLANCPCYSLFTPAENEQHCGISDALNNCTDVASKTRDAYQIQVYSDP